jgi:hypothetical protein
MDSITAGLSFLYSTLNADNTFMGYVTNIYTAVAPQGVQPDYCILQPQSPMDVLTATGVRIMSRNLYQVKIAGPVAHYANISAAYARADALLALVRSQNGILCCFRESGLYVPDIVDGVPWVHLGGLYRVEL